MLGTQTTGPAYGRPDDRLRASRDDIERSRIRATRGLVMTVSAKLAHSIRRRLSCALQLRRLDPPGEIIGETGKRPRQRLAGLADRLAVRRQGLCDRPCGDRA